MNIREFQAHKNKRVYPVFVTTRDLTCKTYVWRMCESPYADEKIVTIPKGTEIVINSYSAFDDGHAMMPVSPRKVFKGKGTTLRWFKCRYKDMKYVEHRWSS